MPKVANMKRFALINEGCRFATKVQILNEIINYRRN